MFLVWSLKKSEVGARWASRWESLPQARCHCRKCLVSSDYQMPLWKHGHRKQALKGRFPLLLNWHLAALNIPSFPRHSEFKSGHFPPFLVKLQSHIFLHTRGDPWMSVLPMCIPIMLLPSSTLGLASFLSHTHTLHSSKPIYGLQPTSQTPTKTAISYIESI